MEQKMLEMTPWTRKKIFETCKQLRISKTFKLLLKINARKNQRLNNSYFWAILIFQKNSWNKKLQNINIITIWYKHGFEITSHSPASPNAQRKVTLAPNNRLQKIKQFSTSRSSPNLGQGRKTLFSLESEVSRPKTIININSCRFSAFYRRRQLMNLLRTIVLVKIPTRKVRSN